MTLSPRAGTIVALFALCACAGPGGPTGPVDAREAVDPAASAASGAVGLAQAFSAEGRTPGQGASPARVSARDVRVDGHPDGWELTGVLYEKPAAGRLPAPAVVMMHGCSGMLAANGRPTASNVFWGEHFARLGYRALLLDSFTARGVKEVCTQRDRPLSAAVDRPKDAQAALRWLQRDPGVDPRRVFLIGWSNGAFATLHAARAAVAGRAATPSAPAPYFRAAVAMYPGCGTLVGRGYRAAVPVLIQAGGADDWTPFAPCEQLVREAGSGSAPMAIDVYPGAHHGFDRLNVSIRFRPGVRNPNAPSGWGATVGTDPEARARSIVRVTEFIRSLDVPRETSPTGG